MRSFSISLSLIVLAGLLTIACSAATPAPAPVVVQPTQPPAPSPTTVPTSQPTNAIDAVTLSAPITIEFWHGYGGSTGKAIEAVVADFNKEQAGKITVKSVFQGTQDDLNAKIRAAAQGGGLPNVSTARESDVVEYSKAALLFPLDDYMQSTKYGLSKEELADFLPGVLGRTKLDVYGNRTLGWPMGNSALGLFYNLDFMGKGGFQSPPKTWTEMEEQARAIKQKTGTAAWIWRQNQAGPYFIDMLWTYGVPWITPDGKSTNFNSPESVTVLKMLRGLVDDGVMVIATTAEQDFANGRGAFVLASTGNTTSFFDTIGSNFKWGVTLPPQKAGGQPVTELFGAVTTGFKSNPQAQLATWLFMRYFASAPTQGSFVGASAYFPPQKSAADAAALKELFVKIPQYKQAFEQVAPYMRLLPQHTALGDIRNKISTDVVNEVLLKRLTPEEGAQKLTALANDALK